jgi:hypothetical protein
VFAARNRESFAPSSADGIADDGIWKWFWSNFQRQKWFKIQYLPHPRSENYKTTSLHLYKSALILTSNFNSCFLLNFSDENSQISQCGFESQCDKWNKTSKLPSLIVLGQCSSNCWEIFCNESCDDLYLSYNKIMTWMFVANCNDSIIHHCLVFPSTVNDHQPHSTKS